MTTSSNRQPEPPAFDLRKGGKVHLIGIQGQGMRSLAELFRQSGWHVTGSDLADSTEWSVSDSLDAPDIAPLSSPSKASSRVIFSEGDRSSNGASPPPKEREPRERDEESPTGSESRGVPERSSPSPPSRIHQGHSADHLPEGTDLVIHSDAIPEENPELEKAGRCAMKTLRYAEVLGELLEQKQGIAIAGTHGKSTTAAMTAELMVAAGLDPSYVIGGEFRNGRLGGYLGQGPHLIVEACEYNTNFLNMWVKNAVITSIEQDHFDSYENEEQLEHAFALFAQRVWQEGTLFVPYQAEWIPKITRELPCRVETFGMDPGADWAGNITRWRRGRGRMNVFHHGKYLFTTTLQVPGRHNLQNALAAVALAFENGVPPHVLRKALVRFRGLRRRLEVVGSRRGVVLIDDYAHHPTEVAVSLETIRLMYPQRRIWVVFQPHQASRTRHFLHEFAESLLMADCIVIASVYHAREEILPGEEPHEQLAERVHRSGRKVATFSSIAAIRDYLTEHTTPGDAIVTVGAGDIWKLYNEYFLR